MYTEISYKDRVIQLIDLQQGIDDVRDIIKKEYSIYLSQEQVERIARKASISHESLKEKIINYDTHDQDLPQLILDIFKTEQRALTSKEIVAILKSRNHLWLERKQVSQTLYSKELKDKFYHDRANWTYTLISETKSKIKPILAEKSFEDILSAYIEELKGKEILINTGNANFDSIIKLITRDNKITASEESFILQKIEELKLDKNLLTQVKKLIYERNPFLDHLINLIFEDGIVTEEELDFLSEKKKEHHFSKEFVNNRFWILGIKKYSNYLTQYNQFIDLIKLWYLNDLASNVKPSIYPLINKELDIFNSRNFIEIISETYSNVYKKKKHFIEKKFNKDIESLLNEIKVKESNIEIIDSDFNKSEILKIDDKTFNIVIKSLHFSPLFSFAFERTTGKHVIYINDKHKDFKLDSVELISKIASSMYYSNLTMTDPNTSKYINRILNNIDLVEHE